ncbi:MAG: sporulation protein YtfJ [candidate division Zixibacteria bacterium]|nr:sporulation protein YtfJ [candidate division Zixibacteria bacterium]
MKDLEQLVRTTLTELRHFADTQTVVGAPIQVEGSTIVPLFKLRAGFGAGGGGGTAGTKRESGSGGGTGGGVDVQPVAILIIDASGVRLEPVAGHPPDPIGKIVEMLKSTWIRKKNSADSERTE